jgi:proteic killer suppression protein
VWRSGECKETWILTVPRNWRITFKIDETEGEIFDLDYEDYH